MSQGEQRMVSSGQAVQKGPRREPSLELMAGDNQVPAGVAQAMRARESVHFRDAELRILGWGEAAINAVKGEGGPQ